MKKLALLLLLLGCSRHEDRTFSKNGDTCALVKYNASIDEWNVYNNVDTAVFPEEKDALAFAKNVCGGGDIQIASKR